MDWVYKLLFVLACVLLIFTVPLAFASPHMFHEEPEGPYYETMGIYTHIKDTPTICIMQSEYRDLMFEYSIMASSNLLNDKLPQSLHTYYKTIPFSEHRDKDTNNYPECFVFVLKHEFSLDEKFATTEFFNGYRWINMYNLTDSYNDMVYISTHEIIHAVYGIKHLQCMEYVDCDGIMKPTYNEGDMYNLKQSDIDMIIEVDNYVQDHNKLYMPHWLNYN